jgi:hypothetical protein
MENIIKPMNEIAFLNTGLLLLAEQDQKIYARISYASLESIQSMAFHLGGEFEIHRKQFIEGRFHCFGFFTVKVKNLEVNSTFELTEVSFANQLVAFSSDKFICEAGTRLTIIDNSYFVV